MIRIDPNQKHQIIEGFGTSGAWWHTWVSRFPKEKQQLLMRLLFSREEGAGLSIFRYNIPSASGDDVELKERRTTDIEIEPFAYDFGRDQGAISFLRMARELSVEDFVLFANSPPRRMTRNGKTSGGEGGGSNLDMAQAEDFARYLVDVTEHLKAELDLPRVSLSPINEPQWRWGEKGRGQEGCHYTPEEAAATLHAVIKQVLDRSLDVAIEAPESGKWADSSRYAQAMFTDPLIDGHVSHFAVHSYWSNLSDKQKFHEWFTQNHSDKKLAMTEFCQMEWGHDLSMEDGGLHLANVMHDDLAVCGVVSWTWWLAIAAGGYKDGLIYANPETQKIEVTKKLWVMGQFSRFIRPGSRRIDASAEHESLRVSAYLTPEHDRLVVVAINNSDESLPATFAVASGIDARPLELWTTDEQRSLLRRGLTGSPAQLPGKSINTVVFGIEGKTESTEAR